MSENLIDIRIQVQFTLYVPMRNSYTVKANRLGHVTSQSHNQINRSASVLDAYFCGEKSESFLLLSGGAFL